MIGSSSSSSPKISRRLAASATQYCRGPRCRRRPAGYGVNLQLKHNAKAEAGSAIQLHPQRLRLAQIGRSSLTATMVLRSRE